MRKQNTKIHTDFELSICRLHPSVFISLYNMQHCIYTANLPVLDVIQLLPHLFLLHIWHSLCCCCFFIDFLSSQTSSVLCTQTQNKHLDNWHIIIMINNEKQNDKARELYCKCYELLLVCRSFSYDFHPLASSASGV